MEALTRSKRSHGDGTLAEVRPGVWRLRAWAGGRQASRTVRAKNRTEALKLLRGFAQETQAASLERSKRNVRNLLGAWLKHLERTGHAVSTVESYRLIADKHLIPALGTLMLHDVDGAILDEYYRVKGQPGGAARNPKKGLSANTIRVHHAVLSSAFTQAVKWRWLASNPCEQATPPAKVKPDRKSPDADRVLALIEACGKDEELTAAITLGAITGARRGELCGLQWHDVDWQAGTLHIRRQRQPGPGGDRTAPPKTSRPPISLGPDGVAFLRRYRRIVEERAAELGVTIVEDGWLISRDGRAPLVAKGLGEAIAAVSARSGVRITTHLLRYFAATQMVGAGVDVRTAAGRLGHSPEVLLRIYSDWMPRRDMEAAAMLEALVLPPVKEDA